MISHLANSDLHHLDNDPYNILTSKHQQLHLTSGGFEGMQVMHLHQAPTVKEAPILITFSIKGDDEEIEDCCSVDQEERNAEFDGDSFSRLLRRVSLTEAKMYARMSYLGNLAYSIPKIKPASLLKHHGLRFVTSSLALSNNTEKEQGSAQVQETKNKVEETVREAEEQKISRSRISASVAYHIAASAASYLHSRTKGILPFNSSEARREDSLTEGGSEIQENAKVTRSEALPSFVATTDSVTAVVAAKEETKQAVAKELNSTLQSPCQGLYVTMIRAEQGSLLFSCSCRKTNAVVSSAVVEYRCAECGLPVWYVDCALWRNSKTWRFTVYWFWF